MSYPKRTVQLRPTRGFVSDVPPHETGPDFFTLMSNVITRSGFAQRVPGSRSVYGTALGTITDTIMHAVNCEFGGTNYWLIFNDTGGAWSVEGANAVSIENALLGNVTDPYSFSSTLLNGVPVISNGADEPVFWSGSGNIATLTDWTASESCKFITAFQYHLFALDISGPGGTFPSQLKWSAAAEPGTIPDSWTPAADNEAGDVELSDSPGGLLCAFPLRDSLIIYKPSAMYQARYVGGNSVFTFRKIQSTSGALTRRSVCDVNGRHFVVSDGDILLTDGANRRSVGEARVKDWLFNQLDQDTYRNLFCVYNRGESEVIVGFPSTGNTFCDTALVYNVELDSFGVRELDNVTLAAVGNVNDTTESNNWQDRTETWADAQGAWGTSTVSNARASLVLIRENEMQQQDVIDAEAVNASISKYGMHFGNPERVKLVRRVHVRFQAGYGSLLVRIGSQMEPNDAITWCPEVSITDPEQVVNCFALGRYISVSVRGSGEEVWKLTGLDLEIEQRGYF